VTARILALFPELTNVNGDAENALVLARRLEWAGEDAEVVRLGLGGSFGQRPTAVVLGSSVDAALPRLREELLALRQLLLTWLADGVPLLAVGTGMELLGSRIVLEGDAVVEGLALLPATAEPLAVRVADEVVVDADEGRLVGYENHSRGLRLDAGVLPLGTVVQGVGDGRGVDGVRHAGIVGTRLHGPVLARNPALADALLTRALGRPVVPAGNEAAAADAAAAAIRGRLLKALLAR
jgi:CobQ-like glutamine amidotransferase family enzyme